MSNKYQNGKIYKIASNCGDDIYIGSTREERLCQRMSKHHCGYKIWQKTDKSSKVTSYNIFDKYGFDNCYIELIELYPCLSKEELFKREGYYIRMLDCVNKVIPGRTKQEQSKQYRKDNLKDMQIYERAYYQENKEEILSKCKAYREDNIEKRRVNAKVYNDNNKESAKQYRTDNKDQIKERKKQYYLDNKDHIKLKSKLNRESKKNVNLI